MNPSSNTYADRVSERLWSLDLDRLRTAAGELADTASGYAFGDTDRAAELHRASADLYKLVATVRLWRSTNRDRGPAERETPR